MEILAMYLLPEAEYKLYQAASGDYCVSVSRPCEERMDYNLGSRESALAFILEESKVD